MEIADEIIVLKDGQVEKQGTRNEVYPNLMINEKAAVCEGPFKMPAKGETEC